MSGYVWSAFKTHPFVLMIRLQSPLCKMKINTIVMRLPFFFSKTKVSIIFTEPSLSWSLWWYALIAQVVVNPATRAINAHHQYSCEFESLSWRSVLDTSLYCKNGQSGRALFRILRGFPPPIKLYRHNMTDILFKMTFSTITITIAYAEMEFWKYNKNYLLHSLSHMNNII
jgi:hypothetical protein